MNSISRRYSKKPSQFSFSNQRQISNQSRVYIPNAEEMKSVFENFDTNKDGKISQEEYKRAMRALGGTNAKAFEAIDTNGDGFIDFEEFMEVQKMEGGVKTSDISSAFRAFDLDGNGKISVEELFEVMKTLGERCSLEGCRKMARGVDADGDGLVDLDEFMNMMTRSLKLSC